MPIVKLPNGTDLNFPDGMTEDQMSSAIYANFPEYAPAKPAETNRTWGQAAQDTGVQLAEGVNTIAGAIPSLVSPEGSVAKFFNENADYWRQKQSEPLLQKEKIASEAISKAGEDGVLAQIGEAASQYFNDPALAARFITTNLPSMIPGIGAAKVAQVSALAKGATAARAASIAGTTGGGVNAVLNAGGARSDAFEDIKKTLVAQGMTPEQAEDQAIKDSRIVAAIGGIAGFVSGKTGLEKSLVSGGAKSGVKAGAISAAKELGGEQLEELAPKFATNVQASQYDDRSFTKDIGRTAVETAIGAGPGSVVAGVVEAKSTPQSLAEVETALTKSAPEGAPVLAEQADQLSRIQNVETIQAIGNAPDMDSAIAAATKTLDSTSEAMKAVENIERIFDNASTATTPIPASDTGTIGGGVVNAPSSVDSGMGVDSVGGPTVDAGGLESQPASVGVLPETQPNLALKEEIARLRPTQEAAPIETGADGTSQPTAAEGLSGTGGTDLQAAGIEQLKQAIESSPPFSDEHIKAIRALKKYATDNAESVLNSGNAPVFVSKSGMTSVITPSAQKPGMYQVTRYNKTGAIGDSQYDSIAKAIDDNQLQDIAPLSEIEANDHMAGLVEAEAKYQANKVDQRLTPISKRPTAETSVQPAPTAAAAIENVASSVEVSAKPEAAQVETLGRNGVPISEGGKPFKTQAAAKEARKLQPAMRVVSTEGGYVLAPKTEKQLAAEAKAAQRVGVPKTSPAGEPIPAHAFIASEGGLSKLAQSDLGVGDNPRIGNRNLFGKAGMTIEQATEKLKAEGYLPQGASNNEALALIKRSLTTPQYTPEGVERMAAKEQAAAFEDFLAAEEEAALSDDFDPFVSVAELGYEIEQAENAGYDEASDAIKQEVNAALALAESQGIDVDEIKYNAADETYNQSEQAYYEAAKRILEKAIAGSDGDSNQDVSGEVETLVAPSREEVIEKQDREAEAVRSEKEQQKAKDLAAKKEQERKEIAKASEAAAETYTLGGDAMENLTGQKPMFSRRATETLDAAGVTGKERVDAMIAINRGDITPEQLEAAYPAKNPQTETEAFKRWFGDSKIVNPDGSPKVVYHGTVSNFTKFDKDFVNSQKYAGSVKGAYFFTNNSQVANSYAGRETSEDMENSSFQEGGNVLPVYLSLQNPMEIDADGWEWDAIPYNGKSIPIPKLVKIAKDKGFDGLIVRNIIDYRDMGANGKEFTETNKASTNYIAFNPTQIKSATGNKGTFDPENADLRFSKKSEALDAAYMEAIESGDMDKVQRMVDDAARDAGYVTGNDYRMAHTAPDSDSGTRMDELRDSDLVPDDYWTHPQWYQGTPEERDAFNSVSSAFRRLDLKKAEGKSTQSVGMFVYRAVPKNVKDSTIRNGDWVTPSRAYAENEGKMIPEGYRIISQNVSLNKLWWDGNSIAELGVDDGKNYAYKNTKNNRKLADPITYDDDGKIIPLSKRFNSRNEETRYSRNAASPKTPISQIRAAITKAYGNLLSQLEKRGVTTITQTQDEAITAAAQARADKNGGDVAEIKKSLMEAVKNSIAPKTDAFRRWFGDSKVVDAKGRPLVVYHGTAIDLKDNAFNENLAKSEGGAFYFSHSPLMKNPATNANEYASGRAGDSQQVIPVFLKMQNPFVTGFTEPMPSDGSKIEGWLSRMGDFNRSIDDTKERYYQRAIREARANGNDGVIIRGVEDVPNDAGRRFTDETDVYIVFKPNQIKSATGNNGEYNPENLDIRYSSNGDIQGFFDPESGKSFLIADNLTAETAPSVLMHEVGIHAANDGSLDGVFKRASNILKAGKGNAWIDAVNRRMKDAGETSGEEAAAYITEAYEADRTNAPKSIVQFLKDFAAAIRAWAFKRGIIIKADDLSIADIAAIARANARTLAVVEATGDMKASIAKYTNSAAFKRWFDGSKIVNDDGSPLVVYHGTTADIDSFDAAKSGQKDAGWYGDGFYFTADDSTASAYSVYSDIRTETFAPITGNEKGDLTGANVLPVFVSIKNPYVWPDGKQAATTRAESIALRKELEAQGYDGVVVPNKYAEYGVKGDFYEVVAFNPTQIKSATGNNGDYSPTNPDIRKSEKPKDYFDAGTIEVKNKKSPVAWKDVTGRWQFAPGQSLYNMLGDAATPLLNKWGLKAASPELRKLMRQMSIDVEKATETATAIAGEANKLSEAERLMVSDIVEKEVQAGTIPPEHAIRLAAVINQVMTKQTDELVSLGMLSKESSDRLRDKYLPRFYESKLKDKVGDVWADSIGRMFMPTSAMKGIKGKHLKGRGLYETIPESQVSAYEALGWEVRDPDYNPSVPSVDGKVQMWRDFTRQERDKMGEIRDVSFRMVMGYMQTQKDIALGRMFQAIASDPEMSSRFETEKLSVKVPDSKIEGTGANTYGKLAGRWVSPETFSQLSKTGEAQNEALQFYRKAMGKWKEAKTVLNPVSHANNIISNVTMAHLAGVSYWRPDTYIGAIRDLVKNGKEIAEAKEAGLFLGSMSHEELMQNMPDELKEIAGKQASTTEKVGKTVWDLMTFWLSKPMGVAYQAEDSFFRYLIYKDARSRGTSPEDAVDYAQKYIFTYDDLPSGARKIRDYGIPFFAYTYKAIPALLHTAMVHPVRMAAPASVLWAINAAAYAIAAGDEDDDWKLKLKKYLTDEEYRNKVKEKEKLERDLLPEWNKGTTSLMTPKVIRLGNDELTNLPLFLDMSRMIPGGDLFDVNPNAGGIPLPQPITPSHPLFSLAVGLLANKDTFLGKDLTDSNDTSAEKTAKRANWIWKQLSPAIAVNNYHWERTMNALAQANGGEVKYVPDLIGGESTGIGRDGLPVQPKYAAMQTFGIKVRPMDLEAAESIQIGMKKKLINDIDVELRKIKRLYNKGAIPERVMEAEREKAQLKKQRIREGLTIEGDVKD